MKILASLVLVLFASSVGAFPAAAGGDAPAAGGDPLAACDSDTSARIRFIESRLDAGAPYARNWWTFFTMFYGTGTIYSYVRAAKTGDNAKRANSYVSAAKAAFGTTRLLLAQPTAKLGSKPMREVTLDSREACREALVIGEELLRRNAKESERRYSWKAHLATVAINVAGALIVSEGYGGSRRAWTSAGVGIAVGEVFNWSHPWNGTRDLEDYEREFGGSPDTVRWNLIPDATGLRILARF